MLGALRTAVNCSILLTEEPLLARPGAARRLGFDAIELWWPFAHPVPRDRDVDRLCSAIQDAGVRLVALNLFAGDLARGDRGVLSSADRSAELRDNVDVVAGIAARLGVRGCNALYGNRSDDVAPERQDDVAVENLGFAAERLADVGATVLIEPLSGHDRYPVRLAADALAVIDRVRVASGHENVGMLADLYHLATNGDDVDRVVTDHVARVEHVQIADAPGRHQPGTGTLPLARYLRSLEQAGYNGWVGLEYQPSGPSAESFGWLARTAVADPARD